MADFLFALAFFNGIGLTLILFLMEASFLWKDSAPLQASPSSWTLAASNVNSISLHTSVLWVVVVAILIRLD
jgi:hypothetical protein